MRPTLRKISFLFFVVTALVPLHRVMAQTITEAETLLELGDTVAALAAFQDLVDRNESGGEAHYRIGTIHFARFLTDESQDEENSEARRHFEVATKLEPDSAQYWLGLSDVLRTKGDIFTRLKSRDILGKAVDLAREHGSEFRPEIELRAAHKDWEQYEQAAHRYRFVGSVQTVDLDLYLSEWGYVDRFFTQQIRPDPAEPGASKLQSAEDHLNTSLSLDPRKVDAAGLLIVALSEQERWEEAYTVANSLIKTAPDSGRAWALLGLALTHLDRWRDAQVAFDTALIRMTPEERQPYRNLALIFKRLDQVKFQEMKPERKAQLSRLYWTVSQPLFLNDLNQPRTEFYARLTYVIHRWSDRFRHRPGYETKTGQVYLRWGPPDMWANIGSGTVSQSPELGALGNIAADRYTILWAYSDSELRFAFSLTPGFARISFPGDFPNLYRQAQNTFPVRFDNVPAVRNLDTVLVQFAQFRGTGSNVTQLAVFSFMPIGRMALQSSALDLQLSTAAILKDQFMRDVLRERREETIRGGDSLQIERRSWRMEVKPGQYLLRVEALLPELDRGARSSSALKIRNYGPDSLSLSDIIVARRVAPTDSSFRRWTDFFIEPSAGLFAPSSPIALLWEVYNLIPDADSTARYTVEVRLTVTEIERRGFAARILGGIGDAVGLSAKGDDQVSLQYDREARARAGGEQVEYITIDLENAPEATYLVNVTVTDQYTGQIATQQRRIRVTKVARE